MKISFCTTCMGRLHHLCQTLPINIHNTSNIDREFIILNYGSKDDLHNWVMNNLKQFMKEGIVKYYRTKIPTHFHATHAKNIAHKQATGEILCNLDADNFVLRGYGELLIENLKKPCLIGSPSEDLFGASGCCGKITCLKDHFYSVNGYNEEIKNGWGWEDLDFKKRILGKNNIPYLEIDQKYNVVLQHSNEERTKNFPDRDLEKTKKESIQITSNSIEKKDYIVNKNKNWGFISDLQYIGL